MTSPFKFLEAYEKGDVNRFFGRSKETAQLYNAVFASNLTLLYGASGTGKTSLINCGLGNKFYDTDWLPIFIRRKDNLNHSFETAVYQNMDEASLAENGNFDSKSIADKIRLLYGQHYKPTYLIFDQFEELFILGSKKEQDSFYQSIAALLKEGLQAKILFIIREEWIAYLNDFEKVLPSLYDNKLRIEKMNDKNLYRVIGGTCRQAGIELVNPANTIMAIIENLRDERKGVELTHLQVYLDRLYRKDQESKNGHKESKSIFDPHLVSSVGQVKNVLSDFLDEQLTWVEKGLSQVGLEKPQGIPLEILFTLVTDDGTKKAMDIDFILKTLPKNRKVSKTHVIYCMDEFKRIKLLRQLE